MTAFFSWHDVHTGDIVVFSRPPLDQCGDNRAVSCDSRYWGPIKGTSIVGKVVLVWWHNSHPWFHWF